MTLTTKALFAAGIVTVLSFGTATLASADTRDRRRDWQRSSARAESSRLSEMQRARAELRRNQAELERDRAALQRLYRSGASRQEINRKRQEVRDDVREIAQDHREISENLEALSRNQDRGFGRATIGSPNDRWGRNDNNGLGWGRDRRDDRVSWGLDDLLGWRFGRD